MKNMSSFVGKSQEPVEIFNSFIGENNLQEISLVDHICYKCESQESYEEWRKLFESDSRFIYQAIISKRRISTIKMSEPIKTILGDIWYLELSEQKPDNSQKETFDHIEIYPKNGNYEELKKYIQDKGVKLKINAKPHHTTYDIEIGEFTIKLEQEPLIEKIKKEELL